MPVLVLCLSLLIGSVGGPQSAPPQASAQQAPAPTYRLLRAAIGPRGAEVQGQYRLDEERTRFSRVRDTQVIVYLQWEGPPGVHRLGARWRGPGGGVSTSSEFAYTAKEPVFGAYWTLPITSGMPLGTWALDATVDGLPTGGCTFEIVDDQPTPATPSRPILVRSELFDRLSAVFVDIERRTGGKTEAAAAFLIALGRLATAFTAVDGTESLGVIVPGGGRREVVSLAAWDRRQDWTLLAHPDASGTPLPLAKAEDAKVGDRCFSMAGGAAGTRLLAEGAIAGRTGTTAGGMRLIVSFNGMATLGAPVVNEYGELIGLVGGSLTPAALTMSELWRARTELRGVPVVPISLVRVDAPAAPASLADLRKTNVLVPPAVGDDHVLSGGFAGGIRRNPVQPVDQRQEFSAIDKTFWAFVSWDAKKRLRGVMQMRTYDEDNTLVVQSKPAKMDLRPGEPVFSQWQIPVPGRPGTYRVDVALGDAILWRGFVRISR